MAPAHTDRMRTERGFDRLVNFSDAVVAIAITLLVLPLVELASDAAGEPSGQGALERIFRENGFQFASFLLSFYVIGTLWRGHHRLFEYLRDYDKIVLRLNMLWLLTIVFLPFSTQMLGESSSDPAANALYVGTIFISSLSLFGLELWVRRHPYLRMAAEDPGVPGEAGRADHDPINGRIWVLPTALAIVGVIATVFPGVGLWGMLLLLVVGPVRRFGVNQDK
ncbi:DUF1211 domain-containing protein [Nakamurella silvestris]|nr:DUF1211 domain-containing protein [Nakamurella silvestris]